MPPPLPTQTDPNQNQKPNQHQANKSAKLRLTSSSPVYAPVKRTLLVFPKEAFRWDVVSECSWNVYGDGPVRRISIQIYHRQANKTAKVATHVFISCLHPSRTLPPCLPERGLLVGCGQRVFPEQGPDGSRSKSTHRCERLMDIHRY
ncbi:hypothetical protein PILCRDRAFT_828789 [Piloderma croceum F 1598]|uniref:Uncharacterized protein n=1 Tax=Piloderma croceum (strain F 1598) TaxID=765440 RepID=A0A0C3AIZ3_PILCF|nr:hypothetical protein PILCRDRAFT_828789 [Piloderma croceum F 1598]